MISFDNLTPDIINTLLKNCKVDIIRYLDTGNINLYFSFTIEDQWNFKGCVIITDVPYKKGKPKFLTDKLLTQCLDSFIRRAYASLDRDQSPKPRYTAIQALSWLPNQEITEHACRFGLAQVTTLSDLLKLPKGSLS